MLRPILRDLWERNYSVYGRRKLTKAARRAGVDVGRDQVARLMRAEGIRGASRAKKRFTTRSDPAALRAPDLVNRDFTASRPDATWVADFTYCSTWSGVVYIAFVIDVFSRRIVGWKAARTMHASLVIDALNMAAWVRRGADIDGVVCHSDAGAQYTSIAYTDRLDEIGAAPSIGTIGDSYDNAMAETTIGLFKTELHRNPRRPRPQRRPLARPRRSRGRHLRVGLVVQRGAHPRRARRPDPRRGRRRLLPSPVSARRGMRTPTQRASVKASPIQKSKGGFRTKRDAQAHLTRVLGEVQEGTWSEPKRITVGQFLRQHWLPSLTQRSSTRASYRTTVEKWIVPHVGGTLLPALTPQHVQQMLETLAESGGRGGTELSTRSVQYAFTVLKMAMQHAAAQGFIARNPLAAMKRPKARSRSMDYWTAAEAGLFLNAVDEDRLRCMWLLFLARGFRRGELVGLRWQNVDLDAGRLSVIATIVVVDGGAEGSEPKTDRGRRSVPLDADLVAALKSHRRRQLEERLAWGAAWVDTGLVFTREDGTALHPETISTRFETLTKRAGLRRIRLHDMRHTAATLALQAGIPVKVVSEWLGHSSVSITLDIYSHVISSMSEELGARLTAIVKGDAAGSWEN